MHITQGAGIRQIPAGSSRRIRRNPGRKSPSGDFRPDFATTFILPLNEDLVEIAPKIGGLLGNPMAELLQELGENRGRFSPYSGFPRIYRGNPYLTLNEDFMGMAEIRPFSMSGNPGGFPGIIRGISLNFLE